MTVLLRTALSLVLMLAMSACAQPIFGPAPQSSVPTPSGQFMAGFGRSDMTPPPGLGLMGFATEGARARGYSMRLYARSLVLRDSAGEMIALVAVDLGMVSGLLQREVAARIRETGIGADRLIVSATHTHSGPGHFFATPAYDEQGSSVEGFDSLATAILADGIARSVREAYANLAPARVAWGTVPIWGRTRVRNDIAVQRNAPRFVSASIPPAELPLTSVYRGIDPELHMLRVDRLVSGAKEPAGTFMIFPVHGTMIPSGNDVFDGDLQAIITQRMEQATGAIDPETGHPSIVHVLANGAEGDIVADFSSDSRCAAPGPVMSFEVEGPVRNIPLQRMRTTAKPFFPECVRRARHQAVAIGNSIADSALSLFRRLGQVPMTQPRIRRAFSTLRIDRDDISGLCRPRTGPGALAGGEGGYTRLLSFPGLRALVGLDTVPLPLGAHANQQRCQGVKPAIDLFELVVAGKHPYPEELQLTVVQIGDRMLATIPGEPTTNAAADIRRAMAAVATSATDTFHQNLVIGLANGYFHYLTTEAEYSAQLYEGAATLYGPRTAQVLARQIGALAAAVRNAHGHSSATHVQPLLAYHRGSKKIWPRPVAAPRIRQRQVHAWIRADTVIAIWDDELPGNIQIAGNHLVQLERATPNGSGERVMWDDDPRVEVRLKHEGKQSAQWEVRFSHVPPGRYRVVLRARGDIPAVHGQWIGSVVM